MQTEIYGTQIRDTKRETNETITEETWEKYFRNLYADINNPEEVQEETERSEGKIGSLNSNLKFATSKRQFPHLMFNLRWELSILRQ